MNLVFDPLGFRISDSVSFCPQIQTVDFGLDAEVDQLGFRACTN